MNNVIAIFELKPIPGQLSAPKDLSLFCVRAIAFSSSQDLVRFLSGVPQDDLPEGAIEKDVNVVYPDGEEAEFSMGNPAIPSLDNALQTAIRARANPASDLRKSEFSEKTPIYLWSLHKQAQKHG